jgi:hypothetical protein
VFFIIFILLCENCVREVKCFGKSVAFCKDVIKRLKSRDSLNFWNFMTNSSKHEFYVPACILRFAHAIAFSYRHASSKSILSWRDSLYRHEIAPTVVQDLG